MSDTWTVGRLIPWAAEYLGGHGVDSPRLCGELLLSHVLGCSRLELYLRFEQPLSPEELAAFKAMIIRRKSREPVDYILGNREFYGLEFSVGPGVLVPRPETEHLVEEALARLEGLETPRVLDLCTGSGAVALTLAHERPDAEVTGCDISPEALTWARRNAHNLGLQERVRWLQGDLWEPVAAGSGFFDVITANPPYVTTAEMAELPPEVGQFEPRLALEGGEDGLDIVRSIIAGAGAHLRPLGWLLVELGAGQAAQAARLAQASGAFAEVSLVKDLAGIERVLVCERKDYG
ncbi:MAG: peptide chain release factor N(5)-glutamine methyltransferase [Proteobacteria bacterium]|nr:peptide chain release factor N(5)-glutamine methyltransferase [Pseudomonadota bacterium]MBU4606129.1 peptide chain release factor N(5)-glutamine methyltransferase [Pseudomonadota bacterium]MCG2766736.1 peptide chain release factor N(5)-glutamine methyltransferase [Desulfarculaceae bacterium]